MKYQKTAEAIMIWLVIKLLIKLQKSQEVHHIIIQKQLQMKMIKKYLKNEYISRRKTENYWWSDINIIV